MGVGHLLRTLALAQAWQDRGGTVVCATIDVPGPVRDRLRSADVEVISGRVAPGSGQDHAWTRQMAFEHKACVVIDGYHLGVSFANVLADAGLRTLLIDDEGSAAPIRAMVLNQNLHGTRSIYPRASSTVLVGTRYSMLRRELLRTPRPPLPNPTWARTAIVTFGGSDPAHLTVPAALALVDAGIEHVHAVVGPAASVPALEHPDIEVHRDPPDFFGLAASADLAITAAGSTVWELAWLGVPMALVSTAPNQEPTLASAVGAGLAISLGAAGDFRSSPPVAALAEFARDGAMRRSLALAGRSLIDGRGASRVAEALETGQEPAR